MTTNVEHAARKAGLRGVVRPTLEQVERRRLELIGVMLVLLLGFSGGMVILSLTSPSFLEDLGGSLTVIRVALVALAVAFGAYVLEKERRLREVTRTLLNERVFSAALVNRLNEVTLLDKASRAVTSSLDLERVLDIVLSSASELLDADEGSLMLAHGDNLLVAAATGRGSLFVGERRPLTEGVAGYVARTRQPILVRDDVDSAELADLIGFNAVGADRIRSSLSVPLDAMGEVLGVLNLNVTTGDRRYEEYDLRLLQLFARNAAVAIHTARIVGPRSTVSRSDLVEIERLRARVAEEAGGSVAAPPDTDRTRPSESRRSAGKILLVEDDPSLLTSLRVTFEDAGFNVDLASDGGTALDRLTKETPDVVVLELAVPVSDGWSVLEFLRERPRKPKIVCLSDRASRRDAIHAWTLGTDEFVTKPVDPEPLAQLVRQVIRRRSEEQTERRHEALRELFAAS